MNNALKAYWIGARGIDNLSVRVYRKDFQIDKQWNKAILKVSATYRYVFWVNGQIVNYGPKRAHAGFVEYDTVDISDYLKIGRNSFAIAVVPSLSCRVISKEGIFVQADIETDDSSICIASDSSWVFAPAPWYGLRNLKSTCVTEFQEHFDSEQYKIDWQINEYPPIPENAQTNYSPYGWYKNCECGEYSPVTVFGPYNTAPWINLIERTVPMLQELDFSPRCVWQGTDDRKMKDIKDNLAILFNESKKDGKAIDASLETYNNSASNIFVFDFLKTRSIRPGISVKSLSGKCRIEFYYSISLGDTPNANRGFGAPDEGCCDSFVPSENNKDWISATYKGFRFLTVRIAGDCQVEFAPNCKLVEYPFREEIKPKINNDILNKAWDIGANTIRSSTTDYYVDTCSRENTLWTFDASVTGKAGFDTFGEVAMWKNSMLGIARSISNFGVPRSAAIPGSSEVLFDQNLTWVHYCLEYYNCTGDLDFLREVYDPISKMLDYCENCVTEEDLFIPQMGTWHYIDWAKINKLPYSLPINAIYILGCDAASKMAELLKRTDEQNIFAKRADRVRNACNRFFDQKEGAFLCHIEPKIEIGEYNKFSFKEPDTSGAYEYNIYANCLAIKAKIGTTDMRKSAADYMALKLAGDSGAWRDIGGGAFDLLLSPLLEYGKVKEVTNCLELRLKGAVINKFPTYGETPDAGIYNTAHGWQSTINSLIKTLAEKYNV